MLPQPIPGWVVNGNPGVTLWQVPRPYVRGRSRADAHCQSNESLTATPRDLGNLRYDGSERSIDESPQILVSHSVLTALRLRRESSPPLSIYNEKADARHDIAAAIAKAEESKRNIVLIFGANW